MSEEIENWLRASAAKGYMKAKQTLGVLYFYGSGGFTRDWDRAFDYLIQCDGSESETAGMLGLIYLDSRSTQYDPVQGLRNIERSLGGLTNRVLRRDIFTLIGFAYVFGDAFIPGAVCDMRKGVKYLETARYADSAHAAMLLGVLKTLGIADVKIDRWDAKTYFKAVLELEDEEYKEDAERWISAIKGLSYPEQDSAFVEVRPTACQAHHETKNGFPDFHYFINGLVNGYYDQIAEERREREEAEEKVRRERLAKEAAMRCEWEKRSAKEAEQKRLALEKKEVEDRPKKIQLTKDRLLKAREMIGQYSRLTNGGLPSSLEALAAARLWTNTRDAWGCVMKYVATDSVYTITSPGPDGKYDTGDDIFIKGTVDVQEVYQQHEPEGEFEKWKARRKLKDVTDPAASAENGAQSL